LLDLGIVTAMADEPHGLGMRELDLVLVLEECGKAALPEPIVESMVAVSLLRDAGDRATVARIAEGAIATVGLEGAPVPDPPVADVLWLARSGGLRLATRDGVHLTREASVDGARRLFRVDAKTTTKLDVPLADARERLTFATSAFLIGLARGMLERTVEYVKI